MSEDSPYEVEMASPDNDNVLVNSESSNSSNSSNKMKNFQLESRFECPICLSCLRSPYITSCGHKFCKECIQQWLRKEGGTCPIDSQKLSIENDIFPDNYTKREISQQIVTCPFPDCSKALPLLDAEKHMFDEHHDDEINSNDRKCCPFYKVGCQHEFNNQSQVISHMQTYMSHHLLLLLHGFDKLNSDMKVLARNEESSLWEAPSKSSDVLSPSSLLKTLYEKIVFLEQTDHEKSIDLNTVKGQLKKLIQQNQLERPRRTNGVLLWKIEKVTQVLKNMCQDQTVKIFSEGFYTSYFGYKFCCKLNISASDPNYLSLNVHLMKGECDYSLNWPFTGRIQVALIHPSAPERTVREVMISNPTLEAFKRPKNEIALRGFGYADFIRLTDLLDLGFINQDDLIHIRVEIVCI